jgi:hypothetical protein
MGVAAVPAVAAACVLSVASSLALRRNGLERAERLSRRAERVPWPVSRSLSTSDIARCVAASGRRSMGANACLARALALRTLLRRRGVDAQVVIGARHEVGFDAHAWVEVDGVSVSEPPDSVAGFVSFGPLQQR